MEPPQVWEFGSSTGFQDPIKAQRVHTFSLDQNHQENPCCVTACRALHTQIQHLKKKIKALESDLATYKGLEKRIPVLLRTAKNELITLREPELDPQLHFPEYLQAVTQSFPNLMKILRGLMGCQTKEPTDDQAMRLLAIYTILLRNTSMHKATNFNLIISSRVWSCKVPDQVIDVFRKLRLIFDSKTTTRKLEIIRCQTTIDMNTPCVQAADNFQAMVGCNFQRGEKRATMFHGVVWCGIVPNADYDFNCEADARSIPVSNHLN